MVKLGQHFLKSEELLKEIADYLEITKDDVVLEIGAGDGRLTKYLTSAKKVYAIEIDKKLFLKLKKKMKEFSNVEVINKDVLDYEFPKEVNKIVGNLPYEISSAITEKILLFLNSQLHKGVKDLFAVLMYQREFAERMTAFPGLRDYSRLSVLVNYYADCQIIKYIPKTAFRPAPKVESALVKLIPKDVKRDDLLFYVAKILFMHKNKKVINALIDSRHFLKEKDKNKLRKILAKSLGKLGEKKVFYLEIDEIMLIKQKIKDLLQNN
ncbi:MAG: ribosomal RNA small subunit methyltransferase A [Nanoarchaeota archaeon]|nr:ribosomal RNA small subunit methyltransferase A [Nanoarchaeota archaeon]